MHDAIADNQLGTNLATAPMTCEDEWHVLKFLDITCDRPHCAMRRKLRIALPKEGPQGHPFGLHEAGMKFDLGTCQKMEKLGLVAEQKHGDRRAGVH